MAVDPLVFYSYLQLEMHLVHKLNDLLRGQTKIVIRNLGIRLPQYVKFFLQSDPTDALQSNILLLSFHTQNKGQLQLVFLNWLGLLIIGEIRITG